ncbi:metal ABC transporter solute-binding protein, Zn/Mn family [Aquibacillus halophilus]|uniref:metal ABC transporter solute-binding protein, Zn/Mn family n=1 Tax=Aquibacillus halophilus TaxID=930132 RepID=UPI001F0DFBEA|nr:zinc ABC transporter substrate-binding protein [Aquibacillus halophilus]
MKIFARLIVLLLIVVLSACGARDEVSSNSSGEVQLLTIYTSMYPLEYFASEIGGAHTDVISILPAGADAHTYEPTSKTMIDIASADAFIYNGAGLEAYAVKINQTLKDENVMIVEATNGIVLLGSNHEHEDEPDVHEEDAHEHEDGIDDHEEDVHDHEDKIDDHNHGDVDPHVWLDPIRAITLAENIKNVLIDIKPDATEDFEENFQDLKSRLEQLDEEFHSKLEAQERNKILVTHAAYGYWENAYGLEQIAINGLSPSDEPSQKKIENVIKLVDKHDINYLLFEQNVRPKVAEVIQSETGVESREIHNLAVLTEDDIEKNENYFTLMHQNLEVLLSVLEK